MTPPHRDDRGAGLVEYALLIGLLAIVSLVAMAGVGRGASGKVSVLGEAISRDGGAPGSATATTTTTAGPTTTVPAATTTTTAAPAPTISSTTTTTAAAAPPTTCVPNGRSGGMRCG